MQDREARFARLFSSAYGPLWAYARRRVPRDDVDDIVAETLTVAWRRLDAVPPWPDALPWLYRVAFKTIGNQMRARDRRLRLVARLSAEPIVHHQESTDPGVLDALERMRPEDREVLRLAAWEDLRPPQIAVVLGCSTNAATLRLSRARKRFREQLTGSDPSRTQTDWKEIDV